MLSRAQGVIAKHRLHMQLALVVRSRSHKDSQKPQRVNSRLKQQYAGNLPADRMMQDIAKSDPAYASMGAGLAPTYSDVPQYGSCVSKIVANKTSLVELYLLAHCDFRALEDYKKARQASKCRLFNLQSLELTFVL